jgi:hypothetical protein
VFDEQPDRIKALPDGASRIASGNACLLTWVKKSTGVEVCGGRPIQIRTIGSILS